MFLLCTKYDQKNCIDIMWKNTLISNKAIENCHAGTALMKKKKKQLIGILETAEILVVIHKSANLGRAGECKNS